MSMHPQGADRLARPSVWGTGERVVLVHGSVSTGAEAWEMQRPLADHGYCLVVPDRRGYGANATRAGAEDYERDAADISAMLEGGAHLVAHSYGAIGALLAAVATPASVRSLVVVEPPAFALAADHPAVAALVSGSKDLWARTDLTDRAFLESFLAGVGAPLDELPDALLEHWAGQTAPLRRCRPPWEAQIPVQALAEASFPKLVVSGGHHPAFEAICAQLSRAMVARHVEIPGAGHEVQASGAPFNQALLGLWRSTP